jgi:hypothetical protein
VAENVKLKAQHEKELATHTQGGKSLDTLLAKQRNDGKNGLGNVDKAKKKKNNKKRNKKKGKGGSCLTGGNFWDSDRNFQSKQRSF